MKNVLIVAGVVLSVVVAVIVFATKRRSCETI